MGIPKLTSKIPYRTASGNWFEHLEKLVEILLYVNRYKLRGLQ
jgi:hypothetical protein